jgi:hypothetical protein
MDGSDFMTSDLTRATRSRSEGQDLNDRIGICWGLVLKCYESKTRKHKVLNVNGLRPSKHYFP